MMYSQLARKALTPAGAAATVASLGFLSEQVSSRASARVVASKTANLNRLFQHQKQPRALYFSSKAGAPAGEAPAAATGASVAKVAATVTADATAAATSAASTATATVATKAKGFSFLAWYEGHLNARPVFTKMCTGSILWGIGDGVAQIVPHMSASKETSSSTPLPPLEYDWPRTGRAVFFGFVIHAPTSHVHFNFLEYITNRAGVTGLGIPVFKAFMEQVRCLRCRPAHTLYCAIVSCLLVGYVQQLLTHPLIHCTYVPPCLISVHLCI
jgi:hypothetical protein